MVLEATMICIDNSEWMRNGDYAPTRLQAQADAVNLICGAKTQSNPENTVGVMTMAGKGVRVLVTPTTDFGKILASMHGLEVGGEMNLTSSVQIAQLALKHRQNKRQQQRIIVFAGSPIKSDKKILEVIGKKLKKNNVALDIVDFGEDDDGKPEKLEALLASVNSNDNSHILHIPAGPNVLSDVVISSSIFTGEGETGSGFAAAAAAASAAATAGGAGGFEFGVDPNLDPELALVLQVSMEEERARQEAAAKRAAEEATAKRAAEEATAKNSNEVNEQGMDSHDATIAESSTSAANRMTARGPDLMEDETALLEQALAMSMNNSGALVSGTALTGDTIMTEARPEDQELASALQMSMQETTKGSSGSLDMSKVLGDQSFVSAVFASLPGVDPNDPSVKDVLASLQGDDQSNSSSGMGVADECKHVFLELKEKKVHRYIVFKIDEKAKQVVVDKTGGPAESYDDFTASLPEDDCRYAVFDFDFVTSENCQKSKIFFIAWSPDASRIRSKMLYATSKERIRRELDGVHYEVQATDPTEMDIEVIRDRAN